MNENTMPGMPSMNDAPEIKPIELNTPSNDESLALEESNDDYLGEVKEYELPETIEVIAKFAGFAKGNVRIIAGEKFTVSKSELGLWMTCVCPLAEKVRVKMLAEKMEAARERAEAKKAKK